MRDGTSKLEAVSKWHDLANTLSSDCVQDTIYAINHACLDITKEIIAAQGASYDVEAHVRRESITLPECLDLIQETEGLHKYNICDQWNARQRACCIVEISATAGHENKGYGDQ